MTLQEWMCKFCPVIFWYKGKPTKLALEVYPYFEIDLLRAWEKSKYAGAREIVHELKRVHRLLTDPVITCQVTTMYDYPLGMTIQSIEKTGKMSCGYERRWEEGIFFYNGEKCGQAIWHKHDGFGREQGRIDVTVYRV